MLDRSRSVHDEGVSVVLRPLASPSSLGLFGLAGATFTLSGYQLGWVPVEQGRQVAMVLIGFGFLAQIVACLMAFAARDGVVATAMGVLSLSWLSVGLTMFVAPKPGGTSKALGLLLVVTATALLLTAITGARARSLAAVVFFVASLRFAVTAVYQLSSEWKTGAGVVGLVLAGVAVVVAWVLELREKGEALVDEPGIRPKL